MTCRLIIIGEESNLLNICIVNLELNELAQLCLEFSVDVTSGGAAAQKLDQVETLVDGATILHVLLLLSEAGKSQQVGLLFPLSRRHGCML